MFSLVVDATALRCYEPSGIGGAQRMVDTPVYCVHGNIASVMTSSMAHGQHLRLGNST